MITKKNISVLLAATSLSISPKIVLAAESGGIIAAVPGWPLPLFLAFIVIFHKKIFSDTDIPPTEPEPTPKPATDKPKKIAEKEEKPTGGVVAQEVSNGDDGVIDLSDGKQCQASTSKKSRCKRANTLQAVNKVIDDKTYLFTICNQHNNDAFKPYPKLIK